MSKENVEFLFSELLSFLILKEAKFLKLLSLDLRVSSKVSYLFDVNGKWKLSLSSYFLLKEVRLLKRLFLCIIISPNIC